MQKTYYAPETKPKQTPMPTRFCKVCERDIPITVWSVSIKPKSDGFADRCDFCSGKYRRSKSKKLKAKRRLG